MIQAAKAVRPSQLYVNENLTQGRAKILFALRQVRRRYPNVVSSCESRDGRICVYMKAPNYPFTMR